VKVRILGCGPSGGVPRVGNIWGACDAENPRNRRLRSSILMENDGGSLLVDCGPDCRQQLLDAETEQLDAVIVTHDHADHCHGIDDMRSLARRIGRKLPLWARQDVLDGLARRFEYAFTGHHFYEPMFDPVPLGQEAEWADGRFRFVDQPHGGITSLGLRYDYQAQSIAYAIDFHDMTEEMRNLYQGVDLFICDCFQRDPHPTHAHLGAVLEWAKELQVGQLLLSHLDISLDHGQLEKELPDWAAPAHDGLEIIL